ncbi:MAG: T9SS type A sorting domain-containing protein [Candidatus Cloacimonetes bacterium]|nr:T9SS type A sorting domain-containing protein [Candidatus Cloacimonadota bacterium]
MKKYLMLIMLIVIASLLLAVNERNIWFNQDFSSEAFPPAGWTISEHAGNWERVLGASAGGASPEAHMSWSPQFNGSSYLISPAVDTSGETTLYLDFDHFVDYYDTPFTVGVATRSNNGAWNVAYSINPTINIGPEHRSVTITNTDVGSSTFQVALYFSGNSYNIDDWFIDNIKLYTPFPFDLGITAVAGTEHVEPATTLNPSCTVKNLGLGQLTATVSLNIFQNDTQVQSYPDYTSQVLAPGALFEAFFPAFVASVPNELYRFDYSVSSLEDVVDGDMTNNNASKYTNTWTSAKQNVLLEIGTGAWCTYCPGAAMAADDFEAGNYNVAIIENHNGDPYATDTSDGRNSYYGISGFPTGIFDGVLRYVGGNHTTSVFPAYLPLYQERNTVKTPVTIQLFGNSDTRNYNLQAKIDKLANLPYQNLVLHLALTESHIQYAWQGQTELNFVNRIMVPDMNGTPLSLHTAPLGITTVPLSFAFDPTWNPGTSELVAFIQNLDTKEVLQAYKVDLIELPPVAAEDQVSPAQLNFLRQNSPNPFSGTTHIGYTLKQAAQVKIEIYNQKGQIVNTLVNESKAAGEYNSTWNGLDANNSPVASGIYFYKLSCGKFSSTKKMILLR